MPSGLDPIVRNGPGGHDSEYWNGNWREYLGFYARALNHCKLRDADDRGPQADRLGGTGPEAARGPITCRHERRQRDNRLQGSEGSRMSGTRRRAAALAVALLAAAAIASIGQASGAATSSQARPIAGTERAETLIGTPGPDTIRGRGGDDTIVGRAGGDRLLRRRRHRHSSAAAADPTGSSVRGTARS